MEIKVLATAVMKGGIHRPGRHFVLGLVTAMI